MDKEYKHITLIGTGNVAHQLGKSLAEKGHVIDGVWGRTKSKAKDLAQLLGTLSIADLSEIAENSIGLICVSDGAIMEVISKVSPTVKVAYTSGSIRLEDLPERANLGVFYPLQTFSQGSDVDISEVPFLIESHSKSFENELFNLAGTISERVILADSIDRYQTHIAAVMVNNFTNFLYYLAEKHLNEHALDFDILKPLINETVRKLDVFSPLEAQTGPAARDDQQVIQKHIQSISQPETKELYKLFSIFIGKEIKNHGL